MDIKQLNYFVHVADLRSFSKAAAVLAMAQPALSRMIRSLETELGAPLFYRNGRGVVVTEAGERLLEGAILAHRFPEAKIAFSGGDAGILYKSDNEAEGAAAILTKLGIARDRLILETDARDTYENAAFLKKELEREGVASPGAGWNAAHRARVEQAVLAHIDRRRDGLSFVNLGKVLSWAGKYEEACNAFQRALDIMGPHPAAYNGMASSLYALGKPEAAIPYYKVLLVMDPAHRSGLHARLARIYAEQEDTEQAIGQCRAELEVDPDNFHMHLALAELLEQQGDSAEAREHYETALQINSDNAATHASFAHYLLRQGHQDEALAHGRLALQLDPKNSRAHTVLGLVLRQQGKTEQAIAHFSEVLRLEPGNSIAVDNLRQLQAEREKTDSGATSP